MGTSMTITFDTLEYVNRLKAADVPAKQAEAQAHALRHALDTVLDARLSQLATKADLVKLENSLFKMESNLLKWFIGTAIAMTSLAFAAAKWIN